MEWTVFKFGGKVGRFKMHVQRQWRVYSLRRTPPQIDWEYYKKNVRAECVAMVEDFEKKYESSSVPYPEDKYTDQIDKIKADLEVEIAEFKKKSNERIAAYEEKMKLMNTMAPYDQMTWEDYCILCPNEAPDFINRPTFWPHNEEEQLGYVPPEDENENDSKNKAAVIAIIETHH